MEYLCERREFCEMIQVETTLPRFRTIILGTQSLMSVTIAIPSCPPVNTMVGSSLRSRLPCVSASGALNHAIERTAIWCAGK